MNIFCFSHKLNFIRGVSLFFLNIFSNNKKKNYSQQKLILGAYLNFIISNHLCEKKSYIPGSRVEFLLDWLCSNKRVDYNEKCDFNNLLMHEELNFALESIFWYTIFMKQNKN